MPKYQTVAVRRQMQTRVNEIESAQANPIAWGVIKDKQKILSEKERLQKTISEITPPDTDGPTKDKLRSRLNQLLPAYRNGIAGVVPPKPTEAQMWNARAGDVGQHMAHEKFWLHHTLAQDGKTVVSAPGRGGEDEIKDIQRTLNKQAENDDPDVANTEIFRDTSSTIPLADAVKRSYGLSEAARANFDEVFPDHELTPVEEKIENAEIERLKAEVAELKAMVAAAPKGKSSISQERRAASRERMRKYWANKKAASQQTATE